MVKFGVNFSRGVKNTGCLFPKMVLFEGPALEIGEKALKSVPQTLEIVQIGSFSGDPDAPARGNRPRLGWSIRPSENLISRVQKAEPSRFR